LKEILFVTGGCRSGKSRFALDYANRHFTKKLYLATSLALDDEMSDRIRRHQEQRGSDWITVEEAKGVSSAISSLPKDMDVVLIDCLTMWVSNLLLADQDQAQILEEIEFFIETIKNAPQSIITVSNEVGYGVVPDNTISRIFRDVVGIANQRIAACSDTVVLTVAGIPNVIKGRLR
jgi:adenosylcobinamide kinase / adenosylcobinamide-phosphate guanylyltransferase